MDKILKFLVVDDSALSRRVVKRCLTERGHVVVEAADGPHALERYVLEQPDFVLLDLVMPGMSGLEVLNALKDLDPGCRVIICSADIQRVTKHQVKAAGALAMVNKPVSIEQISATLNTVLSGQDAWS